MIYMQLAGFAIFEGIPFSVYGENLIVLVQDLVIIALIWLYNKEISYTEKLLGCLFFVAYGLILFTPGILSNEIWQTISGSSIFLNTYSRLIQIWTIYQLQSTG